MYEIFKNIDSHMIISIITSIGIIMTFLGIFFFTYASNVEQDIVQINTGIIVNDLIDIVNPLLDKNTKTNIINSLKYPNMNEEDRKVNENNKNIMTSAFISTGIILGVTMILGYTIAYYYKQHFWPIIGINILILIWVGLTELTFLHLIPKKYIASDTNFVRYNIINDISKKFNLVPSSTNE